MEAMADTATAKYLENNIGGVLSKALAEMSIAQPKDGVDFLSQWLKTYAEQEEAKASRDAEEKMLEEERAKTQRRLQEREAIKQTRISEQEAKDNAYKELFEKFSDPSTVFEEKLWDQLVSVAQRVSGAQAVYLGQNDQDGLDDGSDTGTGPCVRYDRASAGSEFMKEQVLPKEESAKYGMPGITWGVWDSKPTDEDVAAKFLWKPPMPEPPVDPAADPAADPPVIESPWPNFPVYVECVTDVDAVHYFDMTRLGAYLAVPLVYPSYYNDKALTEAQEFERKLQEEKRAAEEAAAAEAEAKRLEEEANPTPEGEEDEEQKSEKVPTPEPEEEKDPDLSGEPVKMVLCLDTLGTNTAFEEEKIKELLELCRVAGECKARMEKRQIRSQARVIVDLDPEAEETDALSAEDKQALDEQKDAELKQVDELDPPLEDPEKELRKDLVGKKYEYLKNLAVLEARKESLFEFKSWVVVQSEVLNVLAGIALIFDYPNEKMYPRRKKVFEWETLKHVLADDLFAKIRSTDMEKPRKKLRPKQKMKALDELLPKPEFEEEAKKVSPVFKDLLMFTQSARNYRQADLEWRKAEFNKEKEEAGEAWEGKEVDGVVVKELSELDDDFKDD